MSQVVDQLIQEEHAAVQAEVDQRVLNRLHQAMQSASDRKANVETEISELQAEIDARTPQAAPVTGQAEGEVPVNQG